MNKLFICAGLAVAVLLSACKKEDLGSAPSNLDATTLSYEAQEGAVVLKWAVPDNAEYHYIEVLYKHPGTGKEHKRLASIHSSSITIDNLLKAYGPIEYKLTPVGKKGARGTTQTISAECLAKPIVRQVVGNSATQLTLNANEMWTDTNQTNDGHGLPGLIDGNNGTFWHMKWSPASPFPHYLVVKLPENVGSAISFYWKGRNNQGRINPKTLEIYGSNTEFTGTTNNPADFSEALYSDLHLIGTVTGMPDALAAEYTSSPIILNASYRYLWFKFKEGHNNTNFSAIAEWKIFKHQVEVYNPETGERTRN